MIPTMVFLFSSFFYLFWSVCNALQSWKNKHRENTVWAFMILCLIIMDLIYFALTAEVFMSKCNLLSAVFVCWLLSRFPSPMSNEKPKIINIFSFASRLSLVSSSLESFSGLFSFHFGQPVQRIIKANCMVGF